MTTQKAVTDAREARRRVLLALAGSRSLVYRANGTYLAPDGEIITKRELKELTDA